MAVSVHGFRINAGGELPYGGVYVKGIQGKKRGHGGLYKGYIRLM